MLDPTFYFDRYTEELPHYALRSYRSNRFPEAHLMPGVSDYEPRSRLGEY